MPAAVAPAAARHPGGEGHHPRPEPDRLLADGKRPFVRFDGLDVPRPRTVDLAGRQLERGPREFGLLAYLAARPGEVVTKRPLRAEVWQQPMGGADKTVDVHLSWLRRKLGETAQEPRYLHTVRGVGIRLSEPFRPAGGEP